jgi:hypothetical protein
LAILLLGSFSTTLAQTTGNGAGKAWVVLDSQYNTSPFNDTTKVDVYFDGSDYIGHITSFDLSNRVFGLSEVPIGDIVIEFDVSKLTTSNVEILKNLPLIIKDSGDIGEFGLDIFKLHIKKMNEL